MFVPPINHREQDREITRDLDLALRISVRAFTLPESDEAWRETGIGFVRLGWVPRAGEYLHVEHVDEGGDQTYTEYRVLAVIHTAFLEGSSITPGDRWGAGIELIVTPVLRGDPFEQGVNEE